MKGFLIILMMVMMIELCFGRESFGNKDYSDTVCSGCTGQCSLIPPDTSKNPCYQGAPEDAAVCYRRDPMMPKGTTWFCGICSDIGFPKYWRNDPVFTTIELWNKN